MDYTKDANCKGAWLFTDGTGTTLTDATTNGKNGTFVASGRPAWSTDVPSFGTKGAAAGSCLFTAATSDYIDMGNSFVPGANAFTFVGWVKTSSAGSFPYCAKTSVSSQGYDFLVGSGGTLGTWQARIVGATAQWNGTTKTSVSSGWNHVAFGCSAGGTSCFWYLNAASVQTGGNTVGTITNDQNLYLGRRISLYYPGYISETAYFDKALSSTEISNIYNYGLKGPPSTGNAIFFGANF